MISEIIGKTIIKIEKTNDSLVFYTQDNLVYKMFHDQVCCESVTLEDIWGDLDDLLDSPITMAEEVSNSDDKLDRIDEIYDSFTWTFYKLATVKGYVTLRWLGESNGYYSESVSFEKINCLNK